jgi:hypothetical protein
MKQFLAFLLAFWIVNAEVSSQAPQLIKYQAIVRNSSGQIIQNQLVSLRVSILQGSMSGASVYTELQSDSVNSTGILTINIGAGSPLYGIFSSIDWSEGPYFLQTEIDPAGGTNYSLTGKSQLLSVPYAMYAGKSAGANSKFEINAHNQTSSDSALFVVRDRNGNAVFTVYENGVEVTYDESVKGAKGGFVVGGRTSAKGTIQNILSVNTDSVRIYIDTTQTKGAKGGFVVGGRTSGKGLANDYFKITGNLTTDTSLTNTFTILKNGNVGINKPNPAEALDIGTGWATVAPGFGWLTPSDVRYKTNIITIANMLDKVMQLRPVRYDLKIEPSAISGQLGHIGFIAQELEQQFPQFVVTNTKGYKSIAYDQLTPVLVEAIQEQQHEIELLKNENEKLKLDLLNIGDIKARLQLIEKELNGK